MAADKASCQIDQPGSNPKSKHHKHNLLDIPALNAFIRSKWFPAVFQWPIAIIFAFIVFELIAGPGTAHDNFGTAGTWVIWWPLIPLIFLIFGRFWCAVCPFATLSDFVQKIVGLNHPVPKFLKKYGIWLIDIFFILITWSDHVFGIVESPRGSGVLLLLIITGVVISGAFFERRTWCRYLCFLGGLSGNYARSGSLELKATPEICAKCTSQACFKGGAKALGCPMFEFPRTMDTMANCNLCGHCIKNCPNDSLQLSARIPSRELWFIKKPKLAESFLAIVIMGIVFVQNITMLEVWQEILSGLENLVGTKSYFVTFTITFIIAMALPVLALLLASWGGKLANKESSLQNLARFGYALIPLDLAAHMAHNLFHLLAEGKSIFYTAMELFGRPSSGASAALVSTPTIQILQFILVGLGTFASIYAVWRIARNHFADRQIIWKTVLPYAVLTLILGAVNVYLFMLPMAMRM